MTAIHTKHRRATGAAKAGAALGAAAALVGLAATAAGASPSSQGALSLSAPIATGFNMPLQIAVRGDTLLVAQSGSGVLTRLDKSGRTDIASVQGGEIAGVDASGHAVWFTSTTYNASHEATATNLSKVVRGSVSTVADLLTYERTKNPDQVNHYGFTTALSPTCAASLPPDLPPPSYTGILDSHPYSVVSAHGKQYVADAAGNDILEVDARGNIRTVAVLPPQPTTLSASAVATLGLPSCTANLTYAFEPVPTDVEMGRDGNLYVTTLPGGPESPELGARGSVYRVNPRTGQTTRIATGFLGAVNLALAPDGSIYVAELFANRVSRIACNGSVSAAFDVSMPGALEYANGKLYVGYDEFVPNDGKVATVDLGLRGHDRNGHDDSADT